MSAVVCTHGRPQLVRRALNSVTRELGPDDEIIVVVDDDSDTEGPLPPGIRVVHAAGRGPAGARAAGLEAAAGRYVAWCDDDDEWLPGHVERLVAELDSRPETALVYGDAEWAPLDGPEPPSVPFSLDFEGFLLADWNYLPISAVIHRTDVARSLGGFDTSLTAFEDWDLWLRMLDEGYALRHCRSTVARQYWHSDAHASTLLSSSWSDARRVAARHRDRTEIAPKAFDPATWTEARELVCRAVMRPHEGYGVVGSNLLLALARRGVHISLAPASDQFPAGTETLQRPIPGPDRLGFYYDYRKRPTELGCDRVVLYTMCESTRVPDNVLSAVRLSSYVLVPCQQNADALREAGVDVPIGVLHHGVDPAKFPYLERPRRERFTFGTFGHLSPRKGTDVLIRAFLAEFGPDDDVKLVLKSSMPAGAYETDDPRVEVVSGGVNPSDLLNLLAGFDAMVLPSRGEGFGLCGLEAMASGLPLIATNWSGPVEYLDRVDSLPLEYRLVEAGGVESNRTQYFGRWAEPDVDHLRMLLRWLYEHPEQAQAMGRAASERVHRDWTWDRVARDLEGHLDAAVAGILQQGRRG